MMYLRQILPLVFLFASSLASAQIGKPLPDVQVLDLDSQAVKAPSLVKIGKPTMVIIWNSMMRPAIAELDTLHKIYPIWQEKYGVDIIAIASEYQQFKNTKLKKFLPKRPHYTYRIFYDEGWKFRAAMGVSGLPATFFLDKEGVVRHSILGFDPGYELKYEEKLIELTK